jgi:hypothetical protein
MGNQYERPSLEESGNGGQSESLLSGARLN